MYSNNKIITINSLYFVMLFLSKCSIKIYQHFTVSCCFAFKIKHKVETFLPYCAQNLYSQQSYNPLLRLTKTLFNISGPLWYQYQYLVVLPFHSLQIHPAYTVYIHT